MNKSRRTKPKVRKGVNMKRIFSLFLALLLLASCAVSTDPEEPAQNSDGQSDASAETAEPETDDYPPCPVPDVTFDGKEFRVLYRQSGYAYDVDDAFSEGLTGEVVNDAVYNRNLTVETKYGVKLAPLAEVSPAETAAQDFMSGSQGYDCMTDCMISTFPYALKGYFYDVNTLTCLNPSDPWWDPNISRDLSVAGHLYIIAGDIITRPKCDARFIYFSKGVMDEYGIAYPYDLVKEGTWTIDRMAEMVSTVSTDLDGDGKITADDRVGLLKESAPNFLTGCGVTFTEPDEEGLPAVSCINERTIAAMEAVHALFDIPNCTLSYDESAKGRDMSGYPHMWQYVRAVFFATNHFLFVQNGADEAPTFRDMEPGYGVIPNPKLDEEQQNYYHLVDEWSCAWFLPAAPVDVEFTDQIFTAWAYHSRDVKEAYYEKTLKHKRLNAPVDAEMLDLIFSSLRYEISLICDLGVGQVINTAYSSGNLASTYAKNEKVINKKRQKMFADILGTGN